MDRRVGERLVLRLLLEGRDQIFRLRRRPHGDGARSHGNLVDQSIHVREVSFDGVQDRRIGSDAERGCLIAVTLTPVVGYEAARFLEAFVTQLAVEALLAALIFGVGLHVLLVRVLGVEALGAELAVVDFVPAVDAHVLLKVGQPSERLAANLTLKAMLDVAVLLKVVNVWEDFVALWATQVFCVGMHISNVLLVLIEQCEGFLALETFVWLPVGMHLQVADERGLCGEALLTHRVVAVVGTVARMHALDVIFKGVCTSEAAVAQLAVDTRPVWIVDQHVPLKSVRTIKHLVAGDTSVDTPPFYIFLGERELLHYFHRPLLLLHLSFFLGRMAASAILQIRWPCIRSDRHVETSVLRRLHGFIVDVLNLDSLYVLSDVPHIKPRMVFSEVTEEAPAVDETHSTHLARDRRLGELPRSVRLAAVLVVWS